MEEDPSDVMPDDELENSTGTFGGGGGGGGGNLGNTPSGGGD